MLSKLGTPLQRWIQEIKATDKDVQVREEIVRPDGSKTTVTVHAKV